MPHHKKFTVLRNEAYEFQLTEVTASFQNIHEKKKQPHLIGVLKYYLPPFGKAMSPIPAVNSDA